MAKAAGHPVVREFQADRAYDQSGLIVLTRRVGRLNPEDIATECVKAWPNGRVTMVDGAEIQIDFESICFQSDTPGALAMGRAIRAGLTDAGITIAPAATILDMQ